ncbi:MAG: PaaI family thioesterase [Sphingomonadales bacterium]|nr:PaaI family thioesterase [Sphingomonadales bacterium]MDE2568097.1 PaaI family thioesterase [Sphingomonadales bacterium]
MGVEALTAFFAEAFPGVEPNKLNTILSIDPGRVRLALDPGPDMLRPGGIVSGPTQMGLADRAAYAVILAHIGPVAMAVTSNLNMSFLRAVPVRRVFADAILLKLGRRLATVDVRLWQDDEARPVAQATVTYAIPLEG